MARFGAFRSAVIAILTLLTMQQGILRAQEKQASKTTPASVATTSQPQAATAQYVGSETCKTCHEEIYNGWEKSPHWKQTYKEGGIAKHGCEDCHGPGSAHVEGGGDKTKIFIFKDHSTKEINDRCLTCHAGGPQHMNVNNRSMGVLDVRHTFNPSTPSAACRTL